MKPTVGRIVHFHDPGFRITDHHFQGTGPYAAIVTQVSENQVDLTIIAPAGETWCEGGVFEKADADAFGHRRYWVWPPRD